jgi:hypothetical protein
MLDKDAPQILELRRQLAELSAEGIGSPIPESSYDSWLLWEMIVRLGDGGTDHTSRCQGVSKLMRILSDVVEP